MTTTVPTWAMSHLDKHLPAGNPVVNAQAVRRNTILANTRLGAVLVRRGLFSGVKHIFLEVPSQKTAFRCSKCQENLQFYNLEIPSDVYCSICAGKYHVDEAGQVSDSEGVRLPAEFKPKQLHPFPPVLDVATKVWDRRDRRRAAKAASAPVARRTVGKKAKKGSRRSKREAAAGSGTGAAKPGLEESSEDARVEPFQHNGYTLFARTSENGDGAVRTLYFFSKREPKSGTPSALPAAYEVGANERTGLPFLRKSRKAPEAEASVTLRPKAKPLGSGAVPARRKKVGRRNA